MADKNTEKPTSSDAQIKLVKERKNAQTYLEGRKETWNAVYTHIGELIDPLREDVRQLWTSGQRMGLKMYDGTAAQALLIQTQGIFGHMMSPSSPWFALGLGREVDEIRVVQQWLEAVTEEMYGAYNNSNFYDEAVPFIRDGIGVGTANITAQENIVNDSIDFMTITPNEAFQSVDATGRVDVLHRKFKLRLKDIVKEYGEENLPLAVQTAFKNNPFDEREMLHCVYDNPDFDSRSLLSQKKQWLSVHILLTGAGSDADSLLRVKGFDQFPYATWMYERVGREEYGRSPSMYALADVMGLNKFVKTMLRSAENAVEPAVNAHYRQYGQLNLNPRGVNWYKDKDSKVEPIQYGSYPIGMDMVDRKALAVRSWFNVDFFLMLNSATREMTAEEARLREGEKTALLSSTIARLQVTLDSISDMVYAILERQGRIPQPPDVVFEMGITKINVNYIGRLAQMQKAFFESQGPLTALNNVFPVAQIDEAVWDNFDLDFLARTLAKGGGMSQSGIRPTEIVAQIRQERKGQEEQEKALDHMESSARTAKDMAAAENVQGTGADFPIPNEEVV